MKSSEFSDKVKFLNAGKKLAVFYFLCVFILLTANGCGCKEPPARPQGGTVENAEAGDANNKKPPDRQENKAAADETVNIIARAVETGDAEAVKAAANKIDIRDIKDPRFATSFIAACKSGKTGIVKTLGGKIEELLKNDVAEYAVRSKEWKRLQICEEEINTSIEKAAKILLEKEYTPESGARAREFNKNAKERTAERNILLGRLVIDFCRDNSIDEEMVRTGLLADLSQILLNRLKMGR